MARVLISTPLVEDSLLALAGHELIAGPPGSDSAAEALICSPTMPVGSERAGSHAPPEGDRRSRGRDRRDRPGDGRSARHHGRLGGRGARRDDRRSGLRPDPRRLAADGRGRVAAAWRPVAWLGLHGHARPRRPRRHARARRLRRDRPRRRPASRRLRDGGAASHAPRHRRGRLAGGARPAARRQRHRQPSRTSDPVHPRPDRRAADRLDRGRRSARQHVPRSGPGRRGARRGAHERRLLAAGLDVYEHEPDVAPELLAAPRAVLLPHIGTATDPTRRAMLALAAQRVAGILAASG